MSINYYIKSGLGLEPNTQMITVSVIILGGFIDAHRGKRGGAPHVPPQKTLKNLVIKIQ
jgi:hypothetical protein